MTLGGHIQTKESFLYGRFETMVKPAYGSGIVSSFFTFYDGVDFPINWQEIDFEFLGKYTNQIDTNIIRTVNKVTDSNINVQRPTLNKRSSDTYWKLCIEWTPNKVLWKINDVVIRTFNVAFNTPQKLMMNIWQGNPGWAGELNTGILPQQATYLYVRYSAYISNQFVFKWQDDFTTLDLNRWQIGERVQGATTFVKEGVTIQNSNLVLKLTSKKVKSFFAAPDVL